MRSSVRALPRPRPGTVVDDTTRPKTHADSSTLDVADRRLLRLVDVAPGVVREQVEDGLDADLGEGLGPFRADALELRDVQLSEVAEALGHQRRRITIYSMPKRYG